jgi:hypothetical protein
MPFAQTIEGATLSDSLTTATAPTPQERTAWLSVSYRRDQESLRVFAAGLLACVAPEAAESVSG